MGGGEEGGGDYNVKDRLGSTNSIRVCFREGLHRIISGGKYSIGGGGRKWGVGGGGG